MYWMIVLFSSVIIDLLIIRRLDECTFDIFYWRRFISPEFPHLSFETLWSQYKIHKLFETIWLRNEYRRRTQSSIGFRKLTNSQLIQNLNLRFILMARCVGAAATKSDSR